MALFDKKSNKYDAWYQTKMGAYVDQVQTQMAFDLFDVHEGETVLDVGCGTGNYSIKLAEKGMDVTAIDISEEMLKLAEGKSEHLNIDYRNMDFNSLDFEDESFDHVFSMTAFELAQDPDQVYSEMYRVLKPDGQLFIGVISKSSSWGIYYTKKGEQKKTSAFNYGTLYDLEDLTRFNPEEIVATDTCLYIPPQASDEEISMERDKELAKTEKPGFVGVIWVKDK